MKEYLTLIEHIFKKGKIKKDRTGTGTKSIFGYQMRFDLQAGFPCLTTKKLHLRSIIYELLWFLKADTNLRYLHEHGVTIWDVVDAQNRFISSIPSRCFLLVCLPSINIDL